MLTLRDYQLEAIEKIRKSLRGGARRVMVVAPTGAGKTILASSIINGVVERDKRALFGAHRREILNQTYAKLVDCGIPKEKLGIIMANDPRRNPVAQVQIASVDTLRNRTKPPANLVFIDECLVAGTIVGGRSIETISVGDVVQSFNHYTGRVELQRAAHLFRSKPSSLLTITFSDKSAVTCTPGHPLFTDRGYIEAALLAEGDVCWRSTNDNQLQTKTMRCLRDRLHAEVSMWTESDLFGSVQTGSSRRPQEGCHGTVQTVQYTGYGEWEGVVEGEYELPLLFAGMQESIRIRNRCKNDGRHESPMRTEAHARKQPDAPWRQQRAHDSHTQGDGLEAAGSQGQRNRSHGTTSDIVDRARLEDGSGDTDQDVQVHVWLSNQLQGRHRLGGTEDRDRGRRQQSLHDQAQGTGSQEGSAIDFVRVDRVEVHESTSDGTFGGVCPDGHVYNLEVEENHNYFANGVLTHNCHRSLARTYERILECYPSIPIIGMTASPWNAANKGYDQAYDDMVVVATVKQLIAEGWLVQPQCFTIPESQMPDLSEVHMKGSDYNEQELSVALNKKHLVGDIVEHWKRMADKRRTVCFAASVEHSKSIVAAFREAGIAAEHLDGTMDNITRGGVLVEGGVVTKEWGILGRLNSGETLVVSSVGVLSEGWDQPAVKCAILARPTMSLALYIQQVGRILRPWEGVGAIILDHAGNVRRHDLPEEDRDYTLEPTRKKRNAPGQMRTKTCPLCYRMLATTVRLCPCGHEFMVERQDPETVEGTLVRYTLDDKKAEWKRLTDIEVESGTPGWAFKMYREKFKRAPPKEFRPISVPSWTEQEKASYCRWLMVKANKEGRGIHWVRGAFRTKFGEEAPLEIIREGRTSRPELAEGQSEERTEAQQEAVEWIV